MFTVYYNDKSSAKKIPIISLYRACQASFIQPLVPQQANLSIADSCSWWDYCLTQKWARGVCLCQQNRGFWGEWVGKESIFAREAALPAHKSAIPFGDSLGPASTDQTDLSRHRRTAYLIPNGGLRKFTPTLGHGNSIIPGSMNEDTPRVATKKDHNFFKLFFKKLLLICNKFIIFPHSQHIACYLIKGT